MFLNVCVRFLVGYYSDLCIMCPTVCHNHCTLQCICMNMCLSTSTHTHPPHGFSRLSGWPGLLSGVARPALAPGPPPLRQPLPPNYSWCCLATEVRRRRKMRQVDHIKGPVNTACMYFLKLVQSRAKGLTCTCFWGLPEKYQVSYLG